MTIALALRAAVLLGCALLTVRGLRRAPAAIRHRFWTLVMAAVILLPLVTLVTPSWTLATLPHAPLPVASLQDPGSTASPTPPPEAVSGAALWDTGEPGAEHAILRNGDVSRFETLAWLTDAQQAGAREWLENVRHVGTLAWLTGAFATGVYFLAGHLTLLRLRRRATRAPLAWSAAAARIAARAGLDAVPEVLVSPHVPGPLVAGPGRPAVLISPEAATWPASRLEPVLVHELAHVTRHDLRAQMLAHMVVVLHWFNPLAWLAARAMRREQELACDEVVIGSGIAPVAYAADLLAIATTAVDRRVPAVALSMARPSELEGRLMAVLDRRPHRSMAASRVGLPLVLALATGMVAGALVAEEPAATSRAMASARPALLNPPLVIDPNENPAVSIQRDAREATADGNVQVRERAVVRLAVRSGNDVVPALLDALGDPDSRVREKAVAGLMWRRDSRVVPALIAAAADPDARVREKVLVALGLSFDERAKTAVDAARHDIDARVREKATKLSILAAPFSRTQERP